MVDIWILTMMLYPFLSVVLLTIKGIFDNIENNKKQATGSWATKQNWSTRVISCLIDWGLNFALLVFIFCYWTAGVISLIYPSVSRECRDP